MKTTINKNDNETKMITLKQNSKVLWYILLLVVANMSCLPMEIVTHS